MVAPLLKFAVLVLLLSIVTTGLSAQSLVVESTRPAGCHSQLRHPASAMSVDHDCCQTGHDSALVKPAIDAIPTPASRSIFKPVLTLIDTKTHSPETIRFSGDPPVSPPLLI